MAFPSREGIFSYPSSDAKKSISRRKPFCHGRLRPGTSGRFSGGSRHSAFLDSDGKYSYCNWLRQESSSSRVLIFLRSASFCPALLSGRRVAMKATKKGPPPGSDFPRGGPFSIPRLLEPRPCRYPASRYPFNLPGRRASSSPRIGCEKGDSHQIWVVCDASPGMPLPISPRFGGCHLFLSQLPLHHAGLAQPDGKKAPGAFRHRALCQIRSEPGRWLGLTIPGRHRRG